MIDYYRQFFLMCEYHNFNWEEIMNLYPFEHDVIYGLIVEDNKRKEELKRKTSNGLSKIT